MSQNKTKVPGMDDGVNAPVVNNPYARPQATQHKGTVVPGMNVGSGVSNANPAEANSKPVLGFLYSISRKGIGEFWPLHIGQNTIGSSPACDICLREGTVSANHAVVMIRKMKNPDTIIASITDSSSTNGTMLNGVSLGFQSVDFQNGDKILVGENYELVLVLLDVNRMGLKVAENFIPMDEPQDNLSNAPFTPNSPFESGAKPTVNGGDDPYHLYNPIPPVSSGTVGLDGSTIRRGGTQVDR